MTVGDICNRNVVVVRQSETIADAAKRMRASHVGDLVVVEAQRASRASRHHPLDDVLQYLTVQQSELVALVAREQQHERQFRI